MPCTAMFYVSVWYDATGWNSNLSLVEVWQQGLDLYPESYMETHPGANLVANDEIIAHTLQEEFESLAADETSEAGSPIVPVFENLQVECQPAV